MYRDDLGELPYLTMCIKESLRRVPAVASVSRELSAPLTVEGVTLIPGTIVQIGIFDLHHNSSVWGDDHMVRQTQQRSQGWKWEKRSVCIETCPLLPFRFPLLTHPPLLFPPSLSRLSFVSLPLGVWGAVEAPRACPESPADKRFRCILS